MSSITGYVERFSQWFKNLLNFGKPTPEPVIHRVVKEMEMENTVYQIHPRGNERILRKVKLYPALRLSYESFPNDLRYRHQRKCIAKVEGWYIVSKKEGVSIIPVGRFIIADDPYDAIAKL